MRSPSRQTERTTIQQLEAERAQLQEELASIEAQIQDLRIQDAVIKSATKPLPLRKLFPKGSTVRVINRRDPSGLYNSEATVTDHTPRRIWIKTPDKKQHLRAPSNLELVDDGEEE